MNKKLSLITKEKWNQLVNVSRFKSPATSIIRAKHILNVYTGEILSGNVALYDDRIAYVGQKEPLFDEKTMLVDAEDHILVPGYIEPHSHPFQIYNPVSLMEFALARGTTTLILDTLFFYLGLSSEKLHAFLDHMSDLPTKNFWWTRLDPQTTNPSLQAKFTEGPIRKLLERSDVIQAGELTGWREILDEAGESRELMYLAMMSGKRIEAHNPGASIETLNAITAAVATCCHESITADEVISRLRLGLYASLRYSSIRPDLPELLRGLLAKDLPIAWNRLLMTTDGSPPFFLQKGFTDFLIQLAIESGVPTIEAYRMATLNPATYYGFDQHLGGISPGRVADILFLEDLQIPTPKKVMANGKMVAEHGTLYSRFPIMDWDRFGISPLPPQDWKVKPEWFRIQSSSYTYPVVQMRNAVILMDKQEQLPIFNGIVQLPENGEYVYFGLVDVRGKWTTQGIVKGFAKIDALASSYTVSRDIVVLGRDPDQMAKAANHVLHQGGGICLYENYSMIYNLPLPLFGGMSVSAMDDLIKQTHLLVDMLRQRGYTHEDPIYSIFFFTATHLPRVRFTRDGLVSVKTDEVIVPAVDL
jgi:adenine deaminase